MSHEIEGNNIAYANEVPWHGLGTKMDPAAGYKAWMKAAALDWEVKKLPMFTNLPNKKNIEVHGKNGQPYGVLVRDHGNNEFDQKDVFGPVGPEWVPVQNDEVFEFMHGFCKGGDMTMETCGSLKGGTEIWALLKIQSDFDVGKNDPITGHLLFHSAHVWGKGNSFGVTPVRVVCNNTLRMALGNGNSLYRMPHVNIFDAEMQDKAKEAVGMADGQMQVYKNNAKFLAGKKADEETIAQMIAEIYMPNKTIEVVRGETIQDHFSPTADIVMNCVSHSPGADLNTAKGTWWGAFNGVTYYEDHMRMSYVDDSNILASTWFGNGARRKALAMSKCLAYAEEA